MFDRKITLVLVLLLCLAMLVSVSACRRQKAEEDEPAPNGDSPGADPGPGPGADDRELVALYFTGPDGQHLFVEYRLVEVVVNLETAIVQALIDGPDSPDFKATIPEGTVAHDVFVADRVAHVDFSREFVDNHPGGTAAELMTLYSVVHSLAELDYVDAVQFWLENQIVDSILGHLATDIPLRPDPNLVRVTK